MVRKVSNNKTTIVKSGWRALEIGNCNNENPLKLATALKSHFARILEPLSEWKFNENPFSATPGKRLRIDFSLFCTEAMGKQHHVWKHRKFPSAQLHPHTLNKRFERFTDAWSRNFSKQCKFNLTLIRLLSHKCRMSLVRLAFQFSMKRLQEVLNFSIFFQSLLKIYFYYCFWHALARAPVSLQCSVLLNRLSNWHTSRNLNAKGKHLCRWIQDNLRSSESSTPMSSVPFAKWFAKCTRTEQRIRKLLKSDGSCDGTTSS